MAKIYAIDLLNKTYPIGHLQVELNTIRDAEALLDELIQRGPEDADYQDEVMPYWAELWHSALGMSYWLVRHPESVAGKRVIEIGCGLGLPGIVASLLGAEVTFTDYVQEALDFARQNLELNQADHQASFQRLDWRQPPTDQKFDVVLAADVAYEKRFFQPLYHCIRELLKPDGVCYLSEPGRPIGQAFLEGFTQNGFQELFVTNEVAMLDGVERKVSLRGVGVAL